MIRLPYVILENIEVKIGQDSCMWSQNTANTHRPTYNAIVYQQALTKLLYVVSIISMLYSHPLSNLFRHRALHSIIDKMT